MDLGARLNFGTSLPKARVGLMVLLGGLRKVAVRPRGAGECLCCCLGVCHAQGGQLEWALGRLEKPSGSVRASAALGVSHGCIIYI